MSNRPWMPFYTGDYLGDTGHLSTIQHGAYILLIIHYWRTGALPTDDIRLARITKLSLKFWLDHVKPDLESLFLPNWKHKRVEIELAKQADILAKRVRAGRKGGSITATSRFVAKRLSAAQNQAHAGHVPAKTQAHAEHMGGSHSHKELLLSSTDSRASDVPGGPVDRVENGEKPKEASDGAAGKDIARMTRAEFDERLQARRA
jgi:uncharacterized protein YdaU (DUF1376 family)